MTDELNAVARSRAVLGYKDAIAFGGEHEEGVEGAIRAYMSALPPPAGKEGEVVERLRGLLANVSDGGHEYPMSLEEATAIAALITALVAERDEAATLIGAATINMPSGYRMKKPLPEAVMDLRRALEAAEAEAARLRDALAPFTFPGMTWLHGNKVHVTIPTEAIEAARRAHTASET